MSKSAGAVRLEEARALASEGIELRDYFDLMEIERQRGLLVEEIVPLYLLRYGLPPEHTSLWSVLRALGQFDDVEDDPFLEVDRGGDVFEVVRRYWRRRQPEVIDAFDRDARR